MAWIVIIAVGEVLFWGLTSAIAWWWASGDPYGPIRTAAQTAALDWNAEQFSLVTGLCSIGLVVFAMARARRAYGVWGLGAAQVVSVGAGTYVAVAFIPAFWVVALASVGDLALIALLWSRKETRRG